MALTGHVGTCLVTLVNCLMDSMAGHPLSSSFLCLFPLLLDCRSAKDSGSPQSPSKKQQVNLAPEPLKMDLLTMPVVDTEMEAQPVTLEEMDDVGKGYREKKQQSKVPPPTGEGWGLETGQAWVQIHCPCITFWPGELLVGGFLTSLLPLLYVRMALTSQGFC